MGAPIEAGQPCSDVGAAQRHIEREPLVEEDVDPRVGELAETPNLGRPWCPSCEPDADQVLEILDTRWCSAHSETPRGLEDGAVAGERYLSGSSEAGADGAAWAELFHRRLMVGGCFVVPVTKGLGRKATAVKTARQRLAHGHDPFSPHARHSRQAPAVGSSFQLAERFASLSPLKKIGG